MNPLNLVVIYSIKLGVTIAVIELGIRMNPVAELERVPARSTSKNNDDFLQCSASPSPGAYASVRLPSEILCDCFGCARLYPCCRGPECRKRRQNDKVDIDKDTSRSDANGPVKRAGDDAVDGAADGERDK